MVVVVVWQMMAGAVEGDARVQGEGFMQISKSSLLIEGSVNSGDDGNCGSGGSTIQC